MDIQETYKKILDDYLMQYSELTEAALAGADAVMEALFFEMFYHEAGDADKSLAFRNTRKEAEKKFHDLITRRANMKEFLDLLSSVGDKITLKNNKGWANGTIMALDAAIESTNLDFDPSHPKKAERRP